MPFGAAGYAYADKDLRKLHGTPVHMQAEPVLLVSYQNMYTHMYQCLTRHSTKIYCEQVQWDLEAPLGQMLPIGGEAHLCTPPTQLPADMPLFLPTKTTVAKDVREGGIAEGGIAEGGITEGGITNDDAHGEDTPTSAPVKADDGGKVEGGMPSTTGKCAVLRFNKERVYQANGTAHPAQYIVECTKALDGALLTEATNKRRYTNSKGVEQPYNKTDLRYDIERGWLTWELVDIEGDDGGGENDE